VHSEVPIAERRAQRRELRVLSSVVATAEEELNGDKLAPAARAVVQKCERFINVDAAN